MMASELNMNEGFHMVIITRSGTLAILRISAHSDMVKSTFLYLEMGFQCVITLRIPLTWLLQTFFLFQK